MGDIRCLPCSGVGGVGEGVLSRPQRFELKSTVVNQGERQIGEADEPIAPMHLADTQ